MCIEKIDEENKKWKKDGREGVWLALGTMSQYLSLRQKHCHKLGYIYLPKKKKIKINNPQKRLSQKVIEQWVCNSAVEDLSKSL